MVVARSPKPLVLVRIQPLLPYALMLKLEYKIGLEPIAKACGFDSHLGHSYGDIVIVVSTSALQAESRGSIPRISTLSRLMCGSWFLSTTQRITIP